MFLRFALLLLGRLRPKRSCNGYLVTEMLRELYSFAAKPLGFSILSGDGILTSLVTLLQATCDGLAASLFLCGRARRDVRSKCEHEQQQCGQPNQLLHVQPPEDE